MHRQTNLSLEKENVNQTPLTIAKLHEQGLQMNQQFKKNFQREEKLTGTLPTYLETAFN
jgi:hypothetical protein